MGLISVKNFVSPLRSKAQIVALVVGAILVIVVRFVGSRSDTVRELPTGHLTDASARKAVQMEVKAFLDAQDGRRMPGDDNSGDDGEDRGRRPAASTAASIDEMLALQPSDVGGNDREEGSSSPKRLSDIRKSLGLE